METPQAKKRGPKAKGVEKVVYYRRVTPEMLIALDALLGVEPKPVIAASEPVGDSWQTKRIAELERVVEQFRSERLLKAKETPVVAPVLAHGGTPNMDVVNLMADVGRLEAEKVVLEQTIEELQMGTTDLSAKKWMARALKSEARVKELEGMQ